MQSLNDTFRSHPLSRAQQALRKRQVLEAFSDHISESTFSTWHLSLYKFATVRPLKYIRHQTVQAALAFFNLHPDLTIQALSQLQVEISHAIFSLLRPGSSWYNEDRLSLENPKNILEFESIWHPEYQRYCEHVFNHLIRIPLFVLGVLRGSDYQQPALATRVDVLRNNGLTDLIEGYNSTVRNAISHGSITFEMYEILYTDHTRQARLDASEFSRLFDNLVDTCHSILLAVLLFICEHQTSIETLGIGNLPLGLRYVFIDAFASHFGFDLLSMVESSIAINRKQVVSSGFRGDQVY